MSNQHHFTKNDLRNLDVTLDDEALEKQVDELNSKVDDLIGNEIVTSLTPDDADILATMQKNNASDDEIGQWISERVPDYEEIIEDNRAIVLGDFAETSSLTNDDDL